jgi:hypothetical protein
MTTQKGAPIMSTDTDGMAIVVGGDAAAIGEDTFASVDATSRLTDFGQVTLANGDVTATAIAESPDGETAFATVDTYVETSGADVVLVKTSTTSYEQNVISYASSETNLKAIDVENLDSETKVILVDTSRIDQGHGTADVTTDLDGNVATATFDAQASAGNSLVTVDAAALTVEDELSTSAVMIYSAVG